MKLKCQRLVLTGPLEPELFHIHENDELQATVEHGRLHTSLHTYKSRLKKLRVSKEV